MAGCNQFAVSFVQSPGQLFPLLALELSGYSASLLCFNLFDSLHLVRDLRLPARPLFVVAGVVDVPIVVFRHRRLSLHIHSSSCYRSTTHNSTPPLRVDAHLHGCPTPTTSSATCTASFTATTTPSLTSDRDLQHNNNATKHAEQPHHNATCACRADTS